MRGRGDIVESVDRAIALIERYCISMPAPGPDPGPPPAELPAPPPELERLIDAIARLQ